MEKKLHKEIIQEPIAESPRLERSEEGKIEKNEELPRSIKRERRETVLRKIERKEKPAGKLEAVPSKGRSSSDDSNKVKNWVKKLENLGEEEQVELLCDLSFRENLDFAVRVAYELDPKVIDDFHKELTGRLYGKLVSQKKLKQFT